MCIQVNILCPCGTTLRSLHVIHFALWNTHVHHTIPKHIIHTSGHIHTHKPAIWMLFPLICWVFFWPLCHTRTETHLYTLKMKWLCPALWMIMMPFNCLLCRSPWAMQLCGFVWMPLKPSKCHLGGQISSLVPNSCPTVYSSLIKMHQKYNHQTDVKMCISILCVTLFSPPILSVVTVK